ncbi:glycosyltransferase [Microbacterium sp.]|uniref:glycosyltransferase n=1 Tax=Microbacterium sp. TaxID=51671 RepID=UPI003A8A8E74
MTALEADGVEIRFFTWRAALFGRYDLFHLHWPEGLTSGGGSVKGQVTYALTRLLNARLRVTRTPVVRTLHNLRPHDADITPRLRRVLDAFDSRTRMEIHLVPEADRGSGPPSMMIPHGSYVEPFAQYERAPSIPGRVLFFGLIRPYKGVEALLDAFEQSPVDCELRIVGSPRDTALQERIVSAARADPRISYTFGFVSDADLVREVTSAQTVVLPYRELHSSGAALVALSLQRAIVIPDGSTARSLQEEAGTEWVRIFSPPFDEAALAQAASSHQPSGAPDLSARTWARVRDAHHRAYRRALASTQTPGGDECAEP